MRLIFAILGGRVSSSLNARFCKNFQEYNVPITSDEWAVLYCLWEQDGLTQQQLCKITLNDKITISRLVDRMEADGLVERRTCETDKRSKRVCLTQHGIDIQEKASFVANKTLKQVLRGLADDELRTCQEALRIVLGNSRC